MLALIFLSSGRIVRKPQQVSSRSAVNILLITADDMNWNSVGAFGCPVKDITPNIDRFAAQGLKFNYAHVNMAVCAPCRGTLLTGKYGHNSKIEGFYRVDANNITLPDVFKKSGYLTGIIGKHGHSTPEIGMAPYDFVDKVVASRDKEHYYTTVKAFLDRARKEQKPFYFNVNILDPHRPFAGSEEEKKRNNGAITPPSKTYTAGEITLPGFIADLPDARKEVAQYYSSVKRGDDVFGVVIRALEEAGLEKNTVVMFLSDHGMSFPFAKTNVYYHSTRTPWIVRWPAVVQPGTTENQHFISTIDFMPTVLDIAGIPVPRGVDGSSFKPLLQGKKQPNRDYVFTQFHETSGSKRYPMRSVQNKKYGYIFNAWANGKTPFTSETMGGLTFPAMRKAAQSDAGQAKRTGFFEYRTQEEFYDYEKDPDALNNLIHNPAYKEELNNLRKELANWMQANHDPLFEPYRRRMQEPQGIEAFVSREQAEADRRKKQNEKAGE